MSAGLPPRPPAPAPAALLRRPPCTLANLPRCAHAPCLPCAAAAQFDEDAAVDGIIARLCRDIEVVVVHCYLSQQRGPYCAQR